MCHAENVPPSAVLHPLMALATESPEQLLADYSERDGTATWRFLALLGGDIIYVGGSALAPMGWTWEAQHDRSPVDDETVSA